MDDLGSGPRISDGIDSWQVELEEYIRQGEPAEAGRSAAWQAAIGLQAVDGLKTSNYLLETAKQHIEGAISITEAQQRIASYYEARSDRTEKELSDREADVVSSKITELLQERAFRFSPVELTQIHRRLFEGTFDHAGTFRTYNISKRKWVLDGQSVTYASWESIKDTLEYDFGQESASSYRGFSQEQIIKRISGFVSGIWQIHPFCEGSTRTVAVFAIKYLRTLGLEADYRVFAENSWYFRNALVRANYSDLPNGIHETPLFLERFFDNLLADGHHELKNRFMHVRYTGFDQVTDHVTDQVERLLSKMGAGEYSATELMRMVGIKHRATFRENYLNPALVAGLVERTVPDKPRSSRQRYRKARR